ncbi:hypothetical protein LSTR_LSTR016488 [Laodelphax striatellus]|uniref:Uncharacterized protein n=1 Tax=Laodelphax striatellus TaxID=195883 RepID=A0A482XAV8_LAOST|nr:hypothetical protein LSTR_LSTR016488 [Laodelphax striatellus]
MHTIVETGDDQLKGVQPCLGQSGLHVDGEPLHFGGGELVTEQRRNANRAHTVVGRQRGEKRVQQRLAVCTLRAKADRIVDGNNED